MVKRDEVARRAGVSAAVVSYVMNNGPRPVADATRQRVLAAVEELGYRPNGVARALRSRRTWSIGLVVPDNSNPFFAQLAHAIEDETFARGYSLLVGNASGDAARVESYLRTFQDRQVDGLIVVTNGPTEDLARTYEGRVPLVIVVDQPVRGLAASTVKVDNKEGARLATEHLVSHGFTRIACIAGPRDSAPGRERYEGWQTALRAAGLAAPDSLVRWAEFSLRGGAEAVRELLDSSPAPEAVFAATDLQAIGALRGTADAGVSVPDGLAIVGFDGIAEAEYTVPRLATVRQPVGLMGRRAVELLFRENGGDQVHEVFPLTLVSRGTCGCPER
ncbi:LacI family DNA-binding transcriptional regulator [Tenggerimyces flavus]|uniref:LacI family DNA-binding transcriptional regulator n=1 Tax=Tenggerimyces flavus TaxID=1708749 RepID=A0ABV7YIH3_9ACTN|nr:LacI family DNA-binding transcriptional regulator [Tenggerimyces flavus]MBM7787240.1 LacI family transcriptional regulator [Tenggerimyces flavus]